jgi:hypothetical protein
LGPPVERIGAFAGFHLDVFGDDLQCCRLGEARDGGALGFNAEARALLLLCGDTIVGHSPFHPNGIPPFAVCMSLQVKQQYCLSVLQQQTLQDRGETP